MAGIYLHIPFCRRKCGYCNFYSLASTKNTESFVQALCAEIETRSGEAPPGYIDTIYWGGGTPSLLDPGQFLRIMQAIRNSFAIAPDAEISMEANPDDLQPGRLEAWKQGGINRISIGIQSFHHQDLEYLERTHDQNQALLATSVCRDAGFDNLSIDLIYGIPGQTEAMWMENIRHFLSLSIGHLSAYALTLEERTILWQQVRKQTRRPPDDALAAAHFLLLHQELTAAGYEHYEISNLARAGQYSRHNTAYWDGTPYLGFGPSAHSYDGLRRYWNLSHLKGYIQHAASGSARAGEEVLSETDRINEYLMTSLRTMWGCRKDRLKGLGGEELLSATAEAMVPFISTGWVEEDAGGWKLSPEGMFHADGIASALFLSA